MPHTGWEYVRVKLDTVNTTLWHAQNFSFVYKGRAAAAAADIVNIAPTLRVELLHTLQGQDVTAAKSCSILAMCRQQQLAIIASQLSYSQQI